MKSKFITAIKTGDIMSVRLMLSNELMLDPRGRSFDEMLAFAEEQLLNLYEIDNDKSYNIPFESWNEKFLFSLKNDLDDNFSKEKVTFYKKVVMTVLKEKAQNLEREESTNTCKPSTTVFPSTDRNQEKSSNNVARSVIIGGAALTIAGLCFSKIALTSIGVIGILGGIVLYNKSK